jgi:hypothetical protein
MDEVGDDSDGDYDEEYHSLSKTSEINATLFKAVKSQPAEAGVPYAIH